MRVQQGRSRLDGRSVRRRYVSTAKGRERRWRHFSTLPKSIILKSPPLWQAGPLLHGVDYKVFQGLYSEEPQSNTYRQSVPMLWIISIFTDEVHGFIDSQQCDIMSIFATRINRMRSIGNA
jgi:hypothetical protein